jgi:hypothetical protein
LDATAKALEEIARARAENLHAGIQLANFCKVGDTKRLTRPTMTKMFTQEDNWENNYSVITMGNPPTWRLVLNESEPKGTPSNNEPGIENMEEIVFGVQGIVLRRNELPPMMDKLG